MISDYRCFFCLTKAFGKLLEKESISAEEKKCFTNDLIKLYQKNSDSLTTPEIARELHLMMKKYTLDPDPYKKVKRESNDLVISLIPELERMIQKSEDPFLTALKLSIAGNIIDFAVNDEYNLEETIDRAINSDLAIDNSNELRRTLEKAKNVLYLGDNAGEIVFDKLFISVINHPDLTYVVRGGPVINDATMDDAKYTGMTEMVNVISSEYDGPSTIVSKSGKLFREYFSKADIIISKGQGNLEGLLHSHDRRIFFLLMAKCNVMADFLKIKKDSLVVYNSLYKKSA